MISSMSRTINIIMTKPNVILERFPYRFVTTGTLDNGKPDCRIQTYNLRTKRYSDTYLCDNEMQLMTAIEDKDYCLWLHGENCYRRDVSKHRSML
jgi:hypothetical protein